MGMTAATLSCISAIWSITLLWGVGSCSHVSLAMSRRPLGCLPYTNSNGENPVEAFGTSRMANIKYGNSTSQSFPSLFTTFFSILFKVLLNRSTNPSV
ncbi:hypothetical protein GDO81_022300 [Engystomops pustulosus]|uniref:Secreted protein n=1 Tax=Engystomops pustulosus TaxID=76066 RepID=A0AAV6YUP6_ENGPU|nr:hypothetical protein GDO81_022300 [Engystomops pustulosus]